MTVSVLTVTVMIIGWVTVSPGRCRGPYWERKMRFGPPNEAHSKAIVKKLRFEEVEGYMEEEEDM